MVIAAANISHEAQRAIDRLLSIAHLHLRPLREEECKPHVSQGFIWAAEYSGFDKRLFKYRVYVAVDRNYPFSLPSIFLDPPIAHMQYPHAEHAGKLCLYPPGTSAKFPDEPEVELLRLFADLEVLLRNYADPVWCANEFDKEFATYWTSRASKGNQVYSLLPPDQASGVIRVYKTSHLSSSGNKKRHVPFYVFGTADTEISAWYSNLYGRVCNPNGFGNAFHIKSGKPPAPAHFPEKSTDLIDLKGFQDDPTIDAFCKTFSPLPDDILFVVTYQTVNGPVPVLQKLSKGAISGKHPYDGDSKLRHDLRQGACDARLVIDRYFSWPTDTALMCGAIQRVDTSWVHGRDNNQAIQNLRGKTVVMVGVGSLGSEVLMLLAKSGIGRLILIDPKGLSWPNTGRHVLGAKFTGHNKASSAKWLLEINYPHLGPHKAYEEKWEDVYAREPGVFQNCDLIINTTGSFDTGGSFIAFNRATRRDRLPPALYGWAEAFAMAGHATILDHTTTCIECGFQNGSFLHPVVTWDEGSPVRHAAGCETAFQPYGAVDMANVASMVAKTALDYLLGNCSIGHHRVWVGDPAEIRKLGGKPNAEFFERNQKGNYYLSGGWTKSLSCPACRQQHDEAHEIFAAK